MARRIFLSFAEEDKPYREFLVTPARQQQLPIEFVDMTPKRAADEAWKRQTRRAVEGCDAMIALLSWRTLTAPGARWEMQCARAARLPMMGVYIHGERRPTVPQELAGRRVVEWNWEEVAAFVKSSTQEQ
ncbi:MAG TPA: TIR domain-containing protein [Terriglobales bacterium]|nr:TIR domain-containing protein [Terriglobales bacterium]